MVLSCFLVLLLIFSHSTDVYAGYTAIGSELVYDGDRFSSTYDLPSISVYCVSGESYVQTLGGGGSLLNGSGSISSNYGVVYQAWDQDSWFCDFDIYIPFSSAYGKDLPYYVDLPDEADGFMINAYVNVSLSSVSANGVSGGSASCIPSIEQISIVCGNNEFVCRNGAQSYTHIIEDTWRFSRYNTYWHISGLYSITSASSSTVTSTVVLTPTVSVTVGRLLINFMRDNRSNDIPQQTEDLTNGYDSSGGQQVADDLQSGVDDYLQKEDDLFAELNFEVPSLSLGDDTSGILLCSSFLQSIYSSDGFVSHIVTFGLASGFLLFIMGWLKKD